ncbi:MAG: porin, partial [Flavobacterium sp.]
MKKVIIILALALTGNMAFAQDTPLEISGSADLYYKYDFAKGENIPTSFATDHNSISLGMIDIALKKTTG